MALRMSSGISTETFDGVEVPSLDFLGWELVVSVM